MGLSLGRRQTQCRCGHAGSTVAVGFFAWQCGFLTARIVRVCSVAQCTRGAQSARRDPRSVGGKYRVKNVSQRGHAGSRRRCGFLKGDYGAVTGVAREQEAPLRVGVGFFLCQSHDACTYFPVRGF